MRKLNNTKNNFNWLMKFNTVKLKIFQTQKIYKNQLFKIIKK